MVQKNLDFIILSNGVEGERRCRNGSRGGNAKKNSTGSNGNWEGKGSVNVEGGGSVEMAAVDGQGS